MPEKTSDGNWRWSNIVRPSKGELVKVVYGIWMGQGKPGSFSDFWHNGNPYYSQKKSNKKRVSEGVTYSFLMKLFNVR